MFNTKITFEFIIKILTGHFIRYIVIWLGLNPIHSQNSLLSAWQQDLETFRDFGRF